MTQRYTPRDGMDVRTARQARAELTRKRLLDAGVALIEERGYDNVSIGDIVSEVGVSVGTFYHYFESKDAFYYSYLRDNYTSIDDGLKDHLDLPPLYNISHFVRKWFESISSLSTDYLAHWLGHASDREYHENVNLVQDVSRLHIDAIKGCLEEYVARGQLSTGSPIDDLAQQIVTVLYGVDVRWCMSNGNLDLDYWADFIVHLAEDALRPYLLD